MDIQLSDFDKMYIATCTILVLGLFYDGYAQLNYDDDSFITYWHAVLYLGYLLVSLMIWVPIIYNKALDNDFRDCIPWKYDYSFVGTIIFGIGLIGQFIWKNYFPPVNSLEVLVSPMYLLHGIGAILMFTGPLRRKLETPIQKWGEQLFIVFPTTYIVSTILYFLHFASPFHLIETENKMVEDYGLSYVMNLYMGFIFTALILSGMYLIIIRTWNLRIGFGTIFFTLTVGSISLITTDYILLVLGLLTGILVDVVYYLIDGSDTNRRTIRTFSIVIPVILFSLYFVYIQLFSSLDWSVNLWLSVLITSTISSMGISFLVSPPG